jgi:hypothetical protein
MSLTYLCATAGQRIWRALNDWFDQDLNNSRSRKQPFDRTIGDPSRELFLPQPAVAGFVSVLS